MRIQAADEALHAWKRRALRAGETSCTTLESRPL